MESNPYVLHGCENFIPTAPSFFPSFPWMPTAIFQEKVIYFSLNRCYLILVRLASVTLGCFFPFQLSTTQDITQKAEENLSVYFLYLQVLTKRLLILCRSIWALNVNILLLYFGNQDQLGTTILQGCVSKSQCYLSFRKHSLINQFSKCIYKRLRTDDKWHFSWIKFSIFDLHQDNQDMLFLTFQIYLGTRHSCSCQQKLLLISESQKTQRNS